MTVEVREGWLHGTLPDDTGKEWPIVRHPQAAARGALSRVGDLCLHTTETDGYIEQLRYPSQWQTGEGRIGQHIKLGLAGDSVNTHDNVLQQIEMVGRSKLARWLPGEPTLGPTVALTAFLHRKGIVRTGLARPSHLADLPVVLDRGPQAVTTYYRRAVPNAKGVYGHVDIATNSHWDPGSFDYPRFFERVRGAIAVQEGTDVCAKCDSMIDGVSRFLRGDAAPAEGPGAKLYRALTKGVELPKAGTATGTLCDASCTCRKTVADHVHAGRATGPVKEA